LDVVYYKCDREVKAREGSVKLHGARPFSVRGRSYV
jgi:hypothetical protein